MTDPDRQHPAPGQPVRVGGLLDGAATLEESAERLRAEADRLSGLATAGWTLVGPVADDLGQLVDPEGNAGGEGA